jgi:hypothetical protein
LSISLWDMSNMVRDEFRASAVVIWTCRIKTIRKEGKQ